MEAESHIMLNQHKKLEVLFTIRRIIFQTERVNMKYSLWSQIYFH